MLRECVSRVWLLTTIFYNITDVMVVIVNHLFKTRILLVINYIPFIDGPYGLIA